MREGSACNDIGGIVLAGVHRWGESPFEQLLPRPLLPVADSPLISYVLRWLRDAGIRDATVCANSESRLVRRCLGDGSRFGLDIRYYEDTLPRGPAGCVRDAAIGSSARDFVVADGSVIPFVDLDDLIQSHRRSGAALTVVTQPFVDGDATTETMHRPAGIYIFSRRAIELTSKVGYQDIKELLIPNLDARGERTGIYQSDAESLRVTCFDTYRLTNAWMIERMAGGSSQWAGYRRDAASLVHEQAAVHDGARLIGPVMIGPETHIAEGAIILGPTWIGAGCDVGKNAMICRSVLWDACSVAEGATVDHCVLAGGSIVEAEAQLFNSLHTPSEHGAARRPYHAAGIRERSLASATRPTTTGGGTPRLPLKKPSAADTQPVRV